MEISKMNPLQEVAGLSQSALAPAGSPSQGASFLDVLKRSLDQVNSAQAGADTTAQQFETGKQGVSLEDAMVSMQKANISFQEAVQVRNKVVAAYSDIMNMQV